jgi:D-alanyl-D-alanine carboxypeptidase (penicillin-binding protein 5/6)
MLSKKFFIIPATAVTLSLAMTAAIAASILPAPPKLKASSYLVMDYQSGRIIAQSNIDKKEEPASLTKMMTLYIVASELAAGNIHLDDKVTISEKAWRMPGSRMFVEVNDKVSVADLMKGIVVQSGNDASVALAEYVSGSEDAFVSMMNQYAKQLGMDHTHFANATGLPHKDHYSTARDLATLARALIHDYPDEYKLHEIKQYTYNHIKQLNRNQLLWRDDSVDGVKTGHTESAGYCLVASAKRDNMRLITAVMGTDSEEARTRETQTLLNYAFRFYETHKLYAANKSIASSRIWKGNKDSFDLGIKRDLWITIPRGRYDKLDASININPVIIAPVQKGSIQGNLKVSLDGKELATRPLIALDSVNEGSFYERLKDDVRLLFQ